eukprot:SAG11_NODE_3840_length_2194_cov_1.853461_3_plen_160_part_00
MQSRMAAIEAGSTGGGGGLRVSRGLKFWLRSNKASGRHVKSFYEILKRDVRLWTRGLRRQTCVKRRLSRSVLILLSSVLITSRPLANFASLYGKKYPSTVRRRSTPKYGPYPAYQPRGRSCCFCCCAAAAVSRRVALAARSALSQLRWIRASSMRSAQY